MGGWGPDRCRNGSQDARLDIAKFISVLRNAWEHFPRVHKFEFHHFCDRNGSFPEEIINILDENTSSNLISF